MKTERCQELFKQALKFPRRCGQPGAHLRGSLETMLARLITSALPSIELIGYKEEKIVWEGNRHVGMRSGTPAELNVTPEIILKEYITDIHDYPKNGVIFRDITPLLLRPEMLRHAIDLMTTVDRHQDIELVVALEARGFLFGPAIAIKLGAGFVPIRKAGKLPRETLRAHAELEYGLVEIELHQDAILKGQKTLLVDDVLATGGTAKAAIELIRSLGGEVTGAQFLIELDSLNGRNKLDIPVHSVIHY